MRALDWVLVAASVATGLLAVYAIWSAPAILRDAGEEEAP